MQPGITIGLSNATMSLGRIVGPLLAGLLFDLKPEYPYLVSAAVMGLGFIVGLARLAQERGGIASAEQAATAASGETETPPVRISR